VLIVAGSATAIVELTGRDNETDSPIAATSSAAVSNEPAGCGFTDTFDGDTLDPAWERTRPDANLSIADGAVTMDAPEGSDLYEDYVDAPRLLRPVSGDFVAQTDVSAQPSQFYQGAGLVLWAGADQYARVERGYDQYGEVIFEYKDKAPHKRVLEPGPSAAASDADRVVLEIARAGETVSGRWRPESESDWLELGSITMDLPGDVQIGIAVLNRAQRNAEPAPFSATFADVTVTC